MVPAYEFCTNYLVANYKQIMVLKRKNTSLLIKNKLILNTLPTIFKYSKTLEKKIVSLPYENELSRIKMFFFFENKHLFKITLKKKKVISNIFSQIIPKLKKMDFMFFCKNFKLKWIPFQNDEFKYFTHII